MSYLTTHVALIAAGYLHCTHDGFVSDQTDHRNFICFTNPLKIMTHTCFICRLLYQLFDQDGLKYEKHLQKLNDCHCGRISPSEQCIVFRRWNSCRMAGSGLGRTYSKVFMRFSGYGEIAKLLLKTASRIT